MTAVVFAVREWNAARVAVLTGSIAVAAVRAFSILL